MSAIWLRETPSTTVKLPPMTSVRPSGVTSRVQTYGATPCRPTVACMTNDESIAPFAALTRARPRRSTPLSQLKAPPT
jgi:hypothetical protein